mmetsp:Transcript_71569/g.232666  ORF Transcript_71569/g.232666 Transcript_71569/m.232666 type:complete len:498 (+) Transcript_71569:105-1598(+)
MAVNFGKFGQPESDAMKPTIREIVEDIGFGRSQFLVMIMACGPFFAEGLELLMVSLLAGSIASDLDTVGFSGGFMVFLVLLGAALGNVISGPFADKSGRQFPIILGYAMVVVFSITSSFMNTLTTISALRFFVGVGFGLGQPAALVLMNEVAPARWRMASTLGSALFVGLGAISAVFMVMVDDAWLKNFSILQWRLLLRCSAIPVMLLGFCSIFILPESPSFLAATGDYALARDVLQDLAAGNKRQASVSFRCPEVEAKTLQGQFGRALCTRGLLNAASICMGSLVLNFALYGSSYAVPQALVKVTTGDVLGIAPASVLLLSFGLACLLIASGTVLGMRASRKTGIIACLMLSIFSALLFNVSSANAQQLRWPLIVSCLGLWCGPSFAILLLIQASLEMYPALSSTTATAACMAFGRVGTVVAPLLSDYVTSSTGDSSTFFTILAAMEFASIVAFVPLDLTPATSTATADSAAAATEERVAQLPLAPTAAPPTYGSV